MITVAFHHTSFQEPRKKPTGGEVTQVEMYALFCLTSIFASFLVPQAHAVTFFHVPEFAATKGR